MIEVLEIETPTSVGNVKDMIAFEFDKYEYML